MREALVEAVLKSNTD